MNQTLKINEIFFSLQGEGPHMGLPTTFVRLTGCPLRCQYCDTAYAFKDGRNRSIDEIIEQVQNQTGQYVCITGGEPLAQKHVYALITALCDLDYHVSIETSGSFSIAEVDQRATCIVDIKTPGSAEVMKNDWENFNRLRPQDQIKFVICDKADFDWALNVVEAHPIAPARFWFSPSYEALSPTTLADWIINQDKPVRFQIQLHKLLWGDVVGK
jgi:7-carboxy-7-deazaguanine synthase